MKTMEETWSEIDHWADLSIVLSTIWTAAVTSALTFASAVRQAAAVPGDRITFKMVPSPTAKCRGSDAHSRVTVRALGSVQNMHVEVTGCHRTTSSRFSWCSTIPLLRPEVVSEEDRNQQQGQRHLRLHGDLQPRDVPSERHGQSDRASRKLHRRSQRCRSGGMLEPDDTV